MTLTEIFLLGLVGMVVSGGAVHLMLRERTERTERWAGLAILLYYGVGNLAARFVFEPALGSGTGVIAVLGLLVGLLAAMVFGLVLRKRLGSTSDPPEARVERESNSEQD